MFAALTLERDPPTLHDIGPMVYSWLQDAGGFAMALLILYFIVQWVQRTRFQTELKERRNAIVFRIMIVCLIGAVVSYAIFGVAAVVFSRQQASAAAQIASGQQQLTMSRTASIALAAGGAFAIFAICLPVLVDILGLRFRARRIWALARLSMKEAVGGKILWVFLAILAVYLFGSWFLEYNKPEDQVRNYVQVLYWAMTPLLLFTAALLAAFSIPTDIKDQTIHTVLTKPVQRFEVVLGRFIGYTVIMTVALFVMTVLSLGYLLRGINPDARFESLKARTPQYGNLEYHEIGSDGKVTVKSEAINVGREWDYRSYIPGPNPPAPYQYAVWNFNDLPSDLAQRSKVRCEYAFDIYRGTKGVDNKGVQCTFILETWKLKEEDIARFQEERANETSLEKISARVAQDKRPYEEIKQEIENKLCEKYGYYELPGENVVDFHTLTFDVPGGLFKNALEDPDGLRKQLQSQGRNPPLVRLKVRCDDRTQYVGMAKRDLYFRVDNPNTEWDTLWFAWNFIKGGTGLWFRLCLIIGLGIAFSTYLSRVISLLLMGFVYIGGVFQTYLGELANPRPNDGGGPLESLLHLAKRETTAMPLEETTQGVVSVWDVPFRWFLRRALNILPDVDRFDLSTFVSEGFNISGTDLLIHSLVLLGFLLPLAILGYYLIRWREIASTT